MILSQKLPSRLFYKNIDNQRQFILLPIYQPSDYGGVTEDPLQLPGSVTQPTGTSGYDHTEFVTTESALTHHPDDARQVPEVVTENHPTAIYPGIPKVPVTQFGAGANPDHSDFPVEMDPEEPVANTEHPANIVPATGYPSTAPGFPTTNNGYPDTGPGYPNTAPGPGVPSFDFPPRRPSFPPPPTNPGILTPDFGIVPRQPGQDPFEEFPASEPTPRQCLIRTCTQTVSGRNLAYGRALQIIQTEEYLQATDLDVIRRYKRSNLDDDTRTIIINDMLDFNSTFALDTLAKTGLAGLLFGLLYLNVNNESLPNLPGIPDTFNSVLPSRPNRPKRPGGSKKKKKKKKPEKLVRPGQVPLDQPQPGTPGGGRLPIGDDSVMQQALSLVPPGAQPVAVFPPYEKEPTYSSISVIFSESLQPKYNPYHRRYKRKKPQYNNQPKDKFGFRTLVFLVAGESCTAYVNCDSEGYKLAQPRRGFEDFDSDGPVECRAEIDPENACAQQQYNSYYSYQ